MIYLDHYATTPLDQRVLDVMLPYLRNNYGNSASRGHRFGWDAEEAVENAREQVADLISCSSQQIIFTSGATESNNTVLKQKHFESIITSTIEHISIRKVCEYLEGTKTINFIKPNRHGTINPSSLKCHKRPDLISVMMVNNEIGTIQDIKGISNVIKMSNDTSRILLHSDATQAVGKIPVNVDELNVDFLSFSSHKIYGPKGVGALFVRDDSTIEPLMHGGSHENGKRAGTLNVPAIVGFGKACEIAKQEMDETAYKVDKLKVILLDELYNFIPDIRYHNFYPCVPGTLHISLPCRDITSMLGLLGYYVAISASSACMSINNSPSSVLKEVMLDDEEIRKSVRVCIGKFNTIEEMRKAAQYISESIETVNLED